MFYVFFLRALLLQPETASALTVLHPTSPQNLHLCLEPFSLLKYPRNLCCSLLPFWASLMDAIFHPSVDVVIPVKSIKFYSSRNSDSWEVKLGLRWKLLYSGNAADAKSSSKAGFPALFYISSNVPADLSPAQQQEDSRQVQQCWKQFQ